MERLSPIIQEAYGLQSRRIKKEKGRYICETANGTMSVYITHEPPEAIQQQHNIKEHLAENGFPWTDRFQPAVPVENRSDRVDLKRNDSKLKATGQPYIQLGREAYVMIKNPTRHRETDLENEADVLQAFEYLARFHIAARGVPQSAAIPVSPPMPEIYTRQISELTQAGKQARRGPRMSDFDVSFIKHAPIYSEIMQESITRLAETNYVSLHAQAIAQGTICHNALKEENLLAASEATYIINFSEATIDLQLADLAALIRRYAQRSSKTIPVSYLLTAYDNINPLPQKAQSILYPLLIFPWAFMKIITQYYSKKRNWTPGGLISRMETILAERADYEKYVETTVK